jgi:dihydroorotate dehydrogenase
VTLVASGGIFTGRDLFDKTALGAHLCQAYTGFVYRGPRFAELALVELTQRMDAAGAASLASIRGKRELIAAAGQDLRTTRP